MEKLNILCLHGYRQNDSIFKDRSGALRKLLKRHVEFSFLSAPHVIPDAEQVQVDRPGQQLGWWFSRPERSYNALDRTDTCVGFDETLQCVQEAFHRHGPFDGVMGFSQGAALVSLLCSMKQREPSGPLDFKFAILFAGFKSLLSEHTQYYSQAIHVPSLHTIGLQDAVIPSQSSEELAEAFVNPSVYRHNGGHYIPASPPLRTALVEFLSPHMKKIT